MTTLDPELTRRLNLILPRVTSEEFLRGQGLGNEIAFHVFDYPAHCELQVRDHIRLLLETLPKRRPDLTFAHVDLFDFVLNTLRERNLLEKSIEMQRTRGDQALAKALRGVLQEQKLARRFQQVVTPELQDLVLVSGVGSAYPLLRAHALLNNLHSIMGRTPLVLFYPGRYDKMSLRLFGKSGLANYYRAFRLID